MSFPPGQPTPYPITNHQQSASPPNESPYAPPPAKRPRLSPEAASPGVAYTNGISRPSQPVTSSYGNPYAPASTTAQSPYSPHPQTPGQQYPSNSFHQPNAYPGARPQWQQQQSVPTPSSTQQRAQLAGSPPSRAMMPPPPRPNKEEREEKVGVDDINDALFSSGINLKDEENYLHNMYNNKHSTTNSFQSQNTSFDASVGSQGGSFNLLTQNTSFNSQPNVSSSGTFGNSASQESVEEELRHKRAAQARRKAEFDQHHLRHPFLLGNVLRLRCDKLAQQQGVTLDMAGTYVLQPEAKTMVNGNGTEGVVAARAGSVVDATAPFADVLGLISLASGERIRGLLDESYELARARRYADHGRVPVEFKELAVSSADSEMVDIVPENITGTSWDALADDVPADKPQSTIAFQSGLNNKLRHVAKREDDAEKSRARKREARRKAAEANTNGDDDTSVFDISNTDAAAANPSTPAPEVAKLSKKEINRQAKEKASTADAQSATTTNQTAAMMALGKKGNKYSWMSGGASSMPTNRFAKPTPASSNSSTGTSTPAKKDGLRADASAKVNGAKAKSDEMTWGSWRENTAGGRGIQDRDWQLVLGRDGQERKALERSSLKSGIAAAPTKTV